MKPNIGQNCEDWKIKIREMARDEARHGKALKGLLERYFK